MSRASMQASCGDRADARCPDFPHSTGAKRVTS
jgi:hypothetical protein